MKRNAKGRPVLFDCDPGIDDALAIFLALASDEIRIIGITTAAGNVPLDHTTRNSMQLVELAGCDAEVAKGFANPLLTKRETAESVHGRNGLGDVQLPAPEGEISPLKVHDFILKKALEHKGELEIIATGPLSNIANAMMIYPQLKDLIKRIWIMGGASGLGNRTPSAEFNIFADAHAASVVFKGGVPITMCGLDVTNKAIIYEKDILKLSQMNNEVAKKSAQMLQFYLGFYRSFGFEGVAMHDPLTVVVAIDPSIIKSKHLFVDVETEGEFTLGKTVVDIYKVSGKAPNTDVALELDNAKFVQLFEKLMSSYE